MALLAATLVTAALVYAWSYFQSIGMLFHGLMLVFLGAMVGFCLTGDLFNLFVFFELMSVTAYALTGYKIEERGPIQGALNFAISNSLGAFLLLYGIGLIYGRTGALNLAQIGRALSTQPADGLVIVAFVLIAVGLFVKAAVVPFHFWLADAHAVAPTPVCVLFSGVMVELGLYGFLRIYWTVFAAALAPHAEGIRTMLLVAGALTAVVGGVMCFLQRHLKRLLAYSTVSHAGAFLMGVASLSSVGLAGMALYVLGHALVKGALFMATGALLDRFGSVDEIALAGAGRQSRIAGLLFGLGGLAMAGCPLFLSATGKSLVEEALPEPLRQVVVVVLVGSSILTGGAILRATARVFLGLGRDVHDTAARAPTHGDEERESRDERPPGARWGMLTPPLVLLLTAFGLGLTVNQTPLGQVESAAARFMDQSGYIARVLDGRLLTAGLPGEVGSVEASPSSTASGLVSTVGAIALAAAALGLLRVPRRIGRQVEHMVEVVARPLRAIHSGHVGDYAAWLLLGVLAFAATSISVLR
jgi:multicomponent Na+:H+ antiporter subunit D